MALPSCVFVDLSSCYCCFVLLLFGSLFLHHSIYSFTHCALRALATYLVSSHGNRWTEHKRNHVAA
uniref:Uncharacterized protein n=1 Tax=Anguilla anguilla TaxID=7936 RepID=A0A0E9X6I6_ANGAN